MKKMVILSLALLFGGMVQAADEGKGDKERPVRIKPCSYFCIKAGKVTGLDLDMAKNQPFQIKIL